MALKTSTAFSFFVCLIVLILGFGCSSEKTPVFSGAVEYRVYNALIENLLVASPDIPKASLLAILNQTEPGYLPNENQLSNLIKMNLQLSGDIITDYETKNGKSTPLTDLFQLSKPHLLLDDEKTKAVFMKDPSHFWDSFFKEREGAKGIIRVSQVGFNADKTQALVYVGYQCGDKCGQGNFVLLVKEKGQWKVNKMALTWTSSAN